MSEMKLQSPQGKRNAVLCEEAERIFDAMSDGELSPEEVQSALSRCQLTVSAPEALPIRDALIALVDDFLKGNLSFEEFDVAYGQAFHGDLPSWGLSWADVEPLAEIDDRLQWTVKDTPTEEDRAHGFLSREQFREWLVEYRRRVFGSHCGVTRQQQDNPGLTSGLRRMSKTLASRARFLRHSLAAER